VKGSTFASAKGSGACNPAGYALCQVLSNVIYSVGGVFDTQLFTNVYPSAAVTTFQPSLACRDHLLCCRHECKLILSNLRANIRSGFPAFCRMEVARVRMAFVLVLLVSNVSLSLCQGIVRSPESSVGASQAYDTLKIMYGKSKAWRNSFRMGRFSACANRRGSLCSSGLEDNEQAQLLLATSPQQYDSRYQAGGFSAVGRVKNQVGLLCTTHQPQPTYCKLVSFLNVSCYAGLRCQQLWRFQYSCSRSKCHIMCNYTECRSRP